MFNLKKKAKVTITSAAVVAALGLSSCSETRELYSWHKYEDASYQYNKKQTEKTEKKFVNEITKVIENQKGDRKSVPPGIYAEYGFYLYKTGQNDEALKMLNKEIETYPESQIFISRIISQINNE
ncbi:MAG: DUF4810 domain-containing protein [Lachnoclostridium sp.]|nr:DUF4810 domain-containing protein [Lachnoclostridium sp.]